MNTVIPLRVVVGASLIFQLDTEKTHPAKVIRKYLKPQEEQGDHRLDLNIICHEDWENLSIT